jgi:hypothetical protein
MKIHGRVLGAGIFLVPMVFATAAHAARTLLLLSIAVVLSACTQDVWVKSGATVADFEVAKGRCLAASYGSVPSAREIIPLGTGYTTPMNTNCMAMGYSASCTTTGGQYVPPPMMTVDANAGVRTQVFRGCMYSDGWALRRREDAQLAAAPQPPRRPPTEQAKAAAQDYCQAIFKDRPNASMMAVFNNNYETCVAARASEL